MENSNNEFEDPRIIVEDKDGTSFDLNWNRSGLLQTAGALISSPSSSSSQLSSSSVDLLMPPEPYSATATATTEEVKEAEGWTCKICTLFNDADKVICGVCETPINEEQYPYTEQQQQRSPPKPKGKEKCPICNKYFKQAGLQRHAIRCAQMKFDPVWEEEVPLSAEQEVKEDPPKKEPSSRASKQRKEKTSAKLLKDDAKPKPAASKMDGKNEATTTPRSRPKRKLQSPVTLKSYQVGSDARSTRAKAKEKIYNRGTVFHHLFQILKKSGWSVEDGRGIHNWFYLRPGKTAKGDAFKDLEYLKDYFPLPDQVLDYCEIHEPAAVTAAKRVVDEQDKVKQAAEEARIKAEQKKAEHAPRIKLEQKRAEQEARVHAARNQAQQKAASKPSKQIVSGATDHRKVAAKSSGSNGNLKPVAPNATKSVTDSNPKVAPAKISKSNSNKPKAPTNKPKPASKSSGAGSKSKPSTNVTTGGLKYKSSNTSTSSSTIRKDLASRKRKNAGDSLPKAGALPAKAATSRIASECDTLKKLKGLKASDRKVIRDQFHTYNVQQGYELIGKQWTQTKTDYVCKAEKCTYLLCVKKYKGDEFFTVADWSVLEHSCKKKSNNGGPLSLLLPSKHQKVNGNKKATVKILPQPGCNGVSSDYIGNGCKSAVGKALSSGSIGPNGAFSSSPLQPLHQAAGRCANNFDHQQPKQKPKTKVKARSNGGQKKAQHRQNKEKMPQGASSSSVSADQKLPTVIPDDEDKENNNTPIAVFDDYGQFVRQDRPSPPALLYYEEFCEIANKAIEALCAQQQLNGGREALENLSCIKGNKKQSRQQNAMYGSILEPLMQEIIKEAKIESKDVFMDVGSGIGQAVIQVAATVGCKSMGVEIDEARAATASGLSACFVEELKMVGDDTFGPKYDELVELIQGDFVDYREKIEESTAIFINNYGGWWRGDQADPNNGPSLEHQFLQMAINCSVGTRIIVLEYLVDLDSKPGIADYRCFQSPPKWLNWTDKPTPVHIYTLKSQKWVCDKCTTRNDFSDNVCEMCFSRPPKERNMRKKTEPLTINNVCSQKY